MLLNHAVGTCLVVLASSYLACVTGGYIGHHESLGSLGDHLDEHHFPADVEAEHYQHDVGAAASEYAEVAAASEYHSEGESLVGYGHAALAQHHGDGGLDYHGDDLHSKPVPGIDHGKGAFSYSTLYESKDHEEP